MRHESWQRWGEERQVIEAAFARADVGASLAHILIQAQKGPASRILRAALKYDSIDPHLERLATEARQPSVRAVAVKTIADMRASWPIGTEWKWVDKSMGERIRVPKFEFREISSPLARENVIIQAATDRSAIVRKASLSAIIQHRMWSYEARKIATKLTADPSRAVRERATFMMSRCDEPPL